MGKNNDQKRKGGVDLVILVIGSTGSGKSSFINTLLAEDRFKVGHTMASCTNEIGVAAIENSQVPMGHRLFVVDTPGFDNTEEPDTEILGRIAGWRRTFDDHAVLGGVIYLYDISQDRFPTSARNNLERLRHLCGDAVLKKLVIGTTKWARAPGETTGRHEEELRNLHWGSAVLRFDGNHDSAWNFIRILLKQIQREIATQRRIANNEIFGHSDIVILVTGLSGAGKSTFINRLTNKESMLIGHEMTSCTTELDYAIIDPIPNLPNLQGRRMIIVDTPGFNDNVFTDTNILRKIVDWLEYHCSNGVTLGGVIYLHEIHLPRFSTISNTDRMFLRKSFETDSNETFGKVVFATTKWDRLQLEEGTKRSKELEDSHFKLFLEHGSELHSFDDSSERAWDIVNILLNRLPEDGSGFDILPRLASLRKYLRAAPVNKTTRDYLSVLRPLFGLFGRNMRGVK